MSSNNFSNSGDTREKFFEYWNMQSLVPPEPYLGGFTMIPNVLLRYLNRINLGGSQASLGMLMIYMRSRDFKNQGFIHPGHALIAQDMGTTVNTIERNLRKLRDMELIEVEHRISKNIIQSNIYTWNGFNEKFRQLLIEDGLIAK